MSPHVQITAFSASFSIPFGVHPRQSGARLPGGCSFCCACLLKTSVLYEVPLPCVWKIDPKFSRTKKSVLGNQRRAFGDSNLLKCYLSIHIPSVFADRLEHNSWLKSGQVFANQFYELRQPTNLIYEYIKQR